MHLNRHRSAAFRRAPFGEIGVESLENRFYPFDLRSLRPRSPQLAVGRRKLSLASCFVGRDTGSQALACYLDHAEVAHRKHLRHGSILPKFPLQSIDDLVAILVVSQINKIDDNDASEIAKPELVRNGRSCFEIHFERIILLRLTFARAPGVHVDHVHRLSMLDDNVSA